MCLKIVSQSADGKNYLIEGNRRTWVTEDGVKWTEIDPQYRGPIGQVTSDGRMCNGYRGGGGLLS